MAGRQGRRRFGAIRRLPSGRYQVRYRGEWADPRLGRTTFGEWADRWLDSTVNLRANTKAGYRSILARYLRPALRRRNAPGDA
jgi:hypothetical protein